MPSERLNQYNALVDDIQAFRNYIHAGARPGGQHALGLWPRSGSLLSVGRRRRLARLSQPSLATCSHYLEFLRAKSLRPPSVARHLVALKMFYRFLRLEERTSESTFELLSSPALWERIPHVAQSGEREQTD